MPSEKGECCLRKALLLPLIFQSKAQFFGGPVLCSSRGRVWSQFLSWYSKTLPMLVAAQWAIWIAIHQACLVWKNGIGIVAHWKTESTGG